MDNVSSSFHGRDVFSPVAAKLSLTGKPELYGNPLNEPKIIKLNIPVKTDTGLKGEVIYIDNFGNMITNINNKDVSNTDEIVVDGSYSIKLYSSYSQGISGELIAIYGSLGYLEIAENLGRAAGRFKNKPNIEIRKRNKIR